MSRGEGGNVEGKGRASSPVHTPRTRDLERPETAVACV